jgi:FlaA1/EpsC-like NDP-sugar epimerase
MSEANHLLITGGTGSFGNAVLQRFLKTDTFSEIRIFSRDEKKQDDMRQFYRNSRIQYYIGDVRSKSSIGYAMQGYRGLYVKFYARSNVLRKMAKRFLFLVAGFLGKMISYIVI